MSRTLPRTCVAPNGAFVHGVHRGHYTAYNHREAKCLVTLGTDGENRPVENTRNFPEGDVEVASSSWVFEIPNPFDFMGATFIPKNSADERVDGCNPFAPLLAKQRDAAVSPKGADSSCDVIRQPRPLLLALARISQDPSLLVKLAEKSCRFTYDEKEDLPLGLSYEKDSSGRLRPVIFDKHLFELVSNNPHLPDLYKQRMVLTPGVQGDSPIVGEYRREGTHIWEYLRKNSYIPWGHYAANMAQDSVRYAVHSLAPEDLRGLRHLYYQRMYIQLANGLGLSPSRQRRTLSEEELEKMRRAIIEWIATKNDRKETLLFTGNIWGQNFGFDLSPSGYRLNASHQQIHQQYALVPATMPTFQGKEEVCDVALPTFVLGDLVASFCREYRMVTGQPFFETYLRAISNNTRTDGRKDKSDSLIIHEDDQVAVFVPKAQRSQGEVQIITKVPCGNILEADASVRTSLDQSILMVLRILEDLGAEMITAFEISKRYDNPDRDQRLIYCFLPKHPQSPGSFTEFQQRWIIGHYPEDFARTCREKL